MLGKANGKPNTNYKPTNHKQPPSQTPKPKKPHRNSERCEEPKNPHSATMSATSGNSATQGRVDVHNEHSRVPVLISQIHISCTCALFVAPCMVVEKRTQQSPTTNHQPSSLSQSQHYRYITGELEYRTKGNSWLTLSLLLHELHDRRVRINILLHHLRNCHLEVLLRDVDPSFTQSKHASFCTHRLIV